MIEVNIMTIKKLYDNVYQINATNGWWISFYLTGVDYVGAFNKYACYTSEIEEDRDIFIKAVNMLYSNIEKLINITKNDKQILHDIIDILLSDTPRKYTMEIELPTRSINRLMHKAKREYGNQEWTKFYQYFKGELK